MLNIAEAMKSDPGYFKTLSVNDSLFVNYNCPQKETWAKLYTNLNHIMYTVSGTRTITRPEKSIEVKKDTILFLRKSGFEQGKFHDDTWNVIVFAVHDNYIKKIIGEIRSVFLHYDHFKITKGVNYVKKNNLFEIQTNELLHSFFSGMVPYFYQPKPPKEILLEVKLRELLFTILLDEQNSSLLYYLEQIVNDEKFAFIDVMESNYMYNLSLDEFAKLTHHSLTIFKKEFKKIFNDTPGKWLLQKRLEAACLFLKSSDKSVYEIALEIGFESITHFNRVFKEKYSITPLQYKNR